jgi:hypothetical protein
MYDAPRARIEEAPVDRGSVRVGLLAGMGAVLAGPTLFLLWSLGMFELVDRFGARWIADLGGALGLLWIPGPAVLIGIHQRRRGRTDTVLGLLVVVGLALAALLARTVYLLMR